MGRYKSQKIKRLEKLSKNEQQELLFDLINAFSEVKTPAETASLVYDLLTEAETKMLAKRLRIAKLLVEGKLYEEIAHSLHVSMGTIAKVGAWLKAGGGGFRLVIKRLPKMKKIDRKEFSDWDKHKHRYFLYYWPELLLEEILDNMEKKTTKKEKEMLKLTLEKLGKKTNLYKKLKETLSEEYKEKAVTRKRKKLQQKLIVETLGTKQI